MAWYIRYRRRRAAQIYIANALQNQLTQELNANNGSGRGGPPNPPRYPPQAHGSPGVVPYYTYGPKTEFVPPAHSLLQYYTPPSGAPPAGPYKRPYHV
ncbi:hypothetical protein H4582DRAFT_2075652 [Lactarius indigo]|nr:hypothetical protein H4582DRAFT_2075652 [Lactarius indigo]